MEMASKMCLPRGFKFKLSYNKYRPTMSLKIEINVWANVGQELTDVHVQPPHRGVDGVGGARFTVTNLTNLTTVNTLASGQDLGQAQPPPPHSAPPLLTSTNGQPAPMVSAGAADLLHVENIFS